MKRTRILVWVLEAVVAVAACVVISSPTRLYGQVDTGSVLGTIKDQTGAVIPNAKVTLTNEGTNLAFTTTAGGDGSYVFSPVNIGTYSVTAEAPGFAKAVQSHLEVNIGDHVVVNLTLKPGAVTQTVEVTAAAPLLATQNAAVGQVVGQRSVNNLPLNGRNFTFLAQTVAGVNLPQADTRGNAATGAFSANGLRPAQNNYLLNGIDNNEDTVDFLNGTNFTVLPPVDAIQEFKVQTSDFSAEYGRAGGAILNATIKSGTNLLHGDAWEFFRNDRLDAADFFEDSGGVKKGEFRQNQFGGSLGGPVVLPHVYDGRNKLFFFGDYEGLRRVQGSVFTTAVPTALERSSGYTNLADFITSQAGSASRTDDLGRTTPFGTVFDPATTRRVTKGQVDPVTGLTATASGFVRDPFFTGNIQGVTDFTGFCPSSTNCQLNQIPAGRIDPNAVKIANLFPAPNGSNPTATFNNFTSNPALVEFRDAFDTRMDYNLNDKNQIFGTYDWVNDPQLIPGPFGGIADGGGFQDGDQKALSQLASVSWTHVASPTLVNEARIGVNRIHTSRFGPVASQLGIPAQFGISTSVPQVSENGGLPAFGISGLNNLGSNAFLPSDEFSQTYQATDDLTKVYGKHTFKGGFQWEHVKFSTLQPPWSHGQFNYDGVYTNIPDGPTDNTGLAQFVLTPTQSTVPNGVNFVGGTNNVFTSNISNTDDGKDYYGAYFNDDFKVSSKLTLNLGLRWDFFGQTRENFGAQANLVPFPTGSGGQYLIPSRRNNLASLNPAFVALAAQDGIAVVSSKSPGLGNSDNNNFSPRIGFAYQILPKLVMRGGFGIFYNGFENRGFSPNIGENFPFQFNFNFSNPNGETPISSVTFPNFVGTPCANAFTFETGFDCTPLTPSLVKPQGLALRGIQFNYKTPYTQEYNFTLQYAVTQSMTATVAYVGNLVRHLEVFTGSNRVSQILPPGLNIFASSSPGKGLFIPFPDFASNSSFATTQGNSNYNSLQTSLEQHYANGLNFLAAYTWSHCRTDAGDLLNGGSIGFRAPQLLGFGIQGDYGNCNFDVRNVFHFSGGYELPFGKGKRFLSTGSGVVGQLVNGWSMQWVATVEGGQPRTIGCDTATTSGLGCNALLVPGQDVHGRGAPDNFYNAAAFTEPCPPAGFSQPKRCIPETGLGLLGGASSQVSGPGFGRLDYSIFKNFQVTERYRVEFRSEFFNILNHPTFNAPGFGGNGVVGVPGSATFLNKNFGKIGSTRFPFNDPREIQFALKLYF